MEKWADGIVRPANRGEVSGHFGVFHVDGVYSLTHLASGFKAHQSRDASECRAVGDAMNRMAGWDKITLDPTGKLAVVGFTDEMRAEALAVREQAMRKPPIEPQSCLIPQPSVTPNQSEDEND